MATLDQACDQMRADGMPEFPESRPRLNTTRITRYGPKKKAWYRLFEVVGRNGRSYVHGAYGIWGVLESTKISTDWSGLDDAERRQFEQTQRDQAKREEEKRQERARFAARRAREQLMSARHDGTSPYLEHKGVSAEKGLRFAADGTLYVPMIRYDVEPAKLVGLQKIAPNGEKRFNKGMAKEGAACRLGAKPKDGDVIGIAEGVATALSVRAAIHKRHPVFVAFDCGNLAPAVTILRKQYPKSPLILYADDDYLTICQRHQTEGAVAAFEPTAERPSWCSCNPGITKAVALETDFDNFRWLRPQFVDRNGQRWTDFNDLHVAEGLDVVEKQIDAELVKLPGTESLGTQKKKKKLPPEFWDKVNHALKHWVLIRGTDTVWDDQRAKIIKVPHLRLAETKAVVEFWLNNPQRRTVEDDNVIFDPSGRHNPETQVNLFTGMKSTPAEPGDGSCAKLLELLYYLCSEDQAVFDWVLKWTAFPLQHPGAKMGTAVVMYGQEGTGKGLWWRAVREIYEPYSAMITQRELESDFNAWASRKLLVVGNEVVSRQERNHHVGYLKNLVTEEVIQINDKHLPIRQEANHMQIVFLSNELQPLQISPDDRRYLIMRTPPKLTEEFYKDVVGELEQGGAKTLHRRLLDLALGDFHAHAKPLVTEAKRNLIELGKTSPQLFYQDWAEGLLPVPFVPCMSQDVYAAFEAWCKRNGDRVPAKSNRFWQELASIDGVRRQKAYVDDPDDQFSAKRIQRRVFLVGEADPLKDADEDDWIKKSVKAFHAALGEYRKTSP